MLSRNQITLIGGVAGGKNLFGEASCHIPEVILGARKKDEPFDTEVYREILKVLRETEETSEA